MGKGLFKNTYGSCEESMKLFLPNDLRSRLFWNFIASNRSVKLRIFETQILFL